MRRRGPLPHFATGASSVEIKCDVVVVGGGGAGLSAAVAAAEAGAKVVLLEKEESAGGTTARAVGSFTAAGTPAQERAGITDDPKAFAEDMMKFAGVDASRDNGRLRQVLAHQASSALAWLETLGVRFVGPFPEPPHRVPRMHNAVPGGGAYTRVLEAAARGRGVQVITGAAAQSLLTTDGAVAGIVLRRPYAQGGQGLARVLAGRGVVLATGDFSGNEALRRQWLAPGAAAAVPVNPASSGDGHVMALDLGASLCGMGTTLGPQLRFPAPARSEDWLARAEQWRWWRSLMPAVAQHLPRWILALFVKRLLVTHTSPSSQLLAEGAVLVNARGERLDAEGGGAEALAFELGGKGYIVMNAQLAHRFKAFPYYIATAPGVAYAYYRDYVRGRPDLVHRSRTVEGLAQLVGAPVTALRRSLADLPWRDDGPFVALGPVFSMITVTEGGLDIDEQARVCTSGGPIPGLYAAGGLAQGGMVLAGHGLHIAWAVTSGRIAGRSAAAARQA